MSKLPNIVLVHGAWADGSCWTDVIERLQAEDYNVTAPQFPGDFARRTTWRACGKSSRGTPARPSLPAILTVGRS